MEWALWLGQGVFNVAVCVYIVAREFTLPKWARNLDPMALPGYLNNRRRIWMTKFDAAAKAWKDAGI